MAADITITRLPERDGEVTEDALAFTLTKSIDPATLDAELTEAMNWRKDSGIVVDGDAAEASASNPVTLWVLRDDVTAATLRSVVAKHKIPKRPADPMADLVTKAEAGEDFTDAEIQQVLRSLVLRTGRNGPR